VPEPVRHADLLERGIDTAPALGGIEPAVAERQVDVLFDSEIANQVEGLEDESDLPVAHARALGLAEGGDRPALRSYCRRRRLEQTQDREQGRLAAARRPGDRDVIAFRMSRWTPRGHASRLRPW
jgi:hypothetical protein